MDRSSVEPTSEEEPPRRFRLSIVHELIVAVILVTFCVALAITGKIPPALIPVAVVIGVAYGVLRHYRDWRFLGRDY
jgi:hypothetical protein